MTTVNINIKNCNCSGSGGNSGSDTGTDQGFDNEPSTGTTPPRGFSQSAITGRPCKVAVWCYDWVNAWLGAIGDNTWFVSTLIQVALSNFSKTLIRVLQTALGALMAGISLVDGIPGDEPYLITAGIAVALLELGTSYSADKLTEAMIGESVTKFQSDRAKFICMIAKGQNAAESKQNVQSYLASEGYPGPIQWIINSLLNDFYNIVFYTPDWWPGFDEYLTSITEVCCEGLTDGNLIEPGSTQACRGANFVLDGLVGCLTAADMYVQNYSRTSYNSLSGTEAAMLANVQANYFVPDSIVNKAWSWQLSQAELARYMYAKLSGTSWLVPGSGVSTWEMGRLGAHLQTEIAICELRDCETAQAAYELLAGAIDAWLAANVTDQALLNHIRLFCQGLIHPAGAYIGLLFTESADLAGFAGSSDCSECGGDDEGYTWDFSINSNGGTKPNQEAWISSVNGRANSYDGGGHWWTNGYGSWTTFKLRPGKSLFIPSGSVVKVWWENADGSAQGIFEQYQVSQNYGYFAGPNYGGSSPSEVVINRDWSTEELFLTPTLGGLRITKIVIVGVF